MNEPLPRLDSWKAIATYLGRDEKTLRRWEAQGLPIRRVPGGRGNSVFAYKEEIDAWMKSAEPAVSHEPRPIAPEAAPVRTRLQLLLRIAAGVLVIVSGFGLWYVLAPSAEGQLTVDVNELGAIARGADGTERWRYDFPANEQTVLPETVNAAQILPAPASQVLLATAHAYTRPGSVPIGGVLRQFTMAGALRRSFSFDDQLVFGANRAFDATWAVTAIGAEQSYGRTRVAVAAHHHTWWPSVVTLLDERWNRTGTFVHSGWIEALRWISPSRLVIAGFNNSHDGGMVSLLDADHLDGTSPETSQEFQCTNCRAGKPLAYIVMPRSELNHITGSSFNRASLDVTERGVLVQTSEVDRPDNAGVLYSAIYEFSPELELLTATYSARYWERHRALELEGKISHTREQCPERDGPPLIHTWTPAAGWKTVRTKR